MIIDKKISVISIINLGLIMGIAAYFVFAQKHSQKIVYVNNQDVFEKFYMTKEIMNESKKKLQQYTKEVDSLYVLISNPNNSANNEIAVRQYVQAKESLENFSTVFAEKQSYKIWERISTYAETFSKENEYALLLGKQPNQNVLYGQEGVNVTNEFITYINNKYEGNK